MSAVLDFPVKPEARPYLDAFRNAAGEPEWLARFRKQGLSRFAELGFPSRRSENWRYLDLQPLQKQPLLPAEPGTLAAVPPELGFAGAWARVVLVDGSCNVVMSRPLPQGVWLGSMRRAISERPDLVRAAAANDSGVEHPFAALNAAFFADGFVLDLAPIWA